MARDRVWPSLRCQGVAGLASSSARSVCTDHQRRSDVHGRILGGPFIVKLSFGVPIALVPSAASSVAPWFYSARAQ